MSNWDELEADKRQSILDKVAAIYAENGHPSWLKSMVIEKQMVNVLMAGQRQEVQSVKIEGKCSSDQKELADKLKASLTEALAGVKAQVDVAAGYDVGSKFPAIEGVNKVMEDGKTTIQHNEGEVMLVDFWATWCPPCQAPMQHNQSMLEEHGEKWNGKVRILGLSIDNDAATVKSHVEAKKWSLPEHYHVKTEGCEASAMFGIRGVPHVLIVDKSGTIVYKGHPAQRSDLVADFNTLLEGGTLSGVQAPGAAAAANSSEAGGLDDETATQAKAKFWTESEKMMNENADKFKLPRAFLVLVDEAKFDAKSGKVNHKMTVHSQLIGGTQAQHDELKPLLESVNKGPWENENTFKL